MMNVTLALKLLFLKKTKSDKLDLDEGKQGTLILTEKMS